MDDIKTAHKAAVRHRYQNSRLLLFALYRLFPASGYRSSDARFLYKIPAREKRQQASRKGAYLGLYAYLRVLRSADISRGLLAGRTGAHLPYNGAFCSLSADMVSVSRCHDNNSFIRDILF